MQSPAPPAGPSPRSWSVPTLVVLFLAILLILSGTTALAEAPSEAEEIPTDPILQTEMELFERINEIRAEQGLPPFAYNHRLHESARAHARDMQRHRRMSHRGSDGSNPRLRIQRTGYVPRYATEAIGWGFNMERMIDWWLNSPIHRRILLSEKHEQLGVGYAGNPESSWSANWWVLNAATHYP